MLCSRKFVWALAVVCILPFTSTAQTDSSEHPIVVLNLPERIDSKGIVIDYFMTGPFGGTGMLRGMEANAKTYKIDAAVENVSAREMKVIAWLPGCQILTLEIPIREQKSERELACTPVGLVQLKGQLEGSVQSDKPLEITVDYLAMWSHPFFGIYDGMVPQFRIGAALLKDNGSFSIMVPDLASQVGMDKGDFKFVLREQGTGNILAFLVPLGYVSEAHQLKVAHEYPAIVHFNTEELVPVVE